MLIEKIVVIAMGLVAVVPHGDSDRGATILLRDAFLSTPRAELTGGTAECPVHLHVPLVVQAAGHCEGECTPFNVPAASTNPVASSMLGLVSTGSSTVQTLRWVPVLESLSFDELTGTAPAHKTHHWFRYGNARGSAQVDEDCTDDATTCPIVARVEMETGGVKACTLSQYDGKAGPAGFVLKEFEDVAPEGDEPPEGNALAESYAIELDTNLEAPLRLTAENFAGGRTLRSADLYPDADGKIVLVVSNLPLNMAHDHGPDPCKHVARTATAHSAVVYDMAEGAWPAIDRIVPHMTKKATGSTTLDAGCAKYLERIAIQVPIELPSDPHKCKPPGVFSP